MAEYILPIRTTRTESEGLPYFLYQKAREWCIKDGVEDRSQWNPYYWDAPPPEDTITPDPLYADFLRVGVNEIVSYSSTPNDTEIPISIAQHTIIKHSQSGTKLGWAQLYQTVKYPLGEIKTWSGLNILDKITKRMVNMAYSGEIKRLPILFSYMCDNYVGPRKSYDDGLSTQNHGVMSSGEPEVIALSITKFDGGTSTSNVNQSPIVPTVLRNELRLTEPTDILKFIRDFNLSSPAEIKNINIPYTNWWNDSIITISGRISTKDIFMTLQCDTAPFWEGSIAPKVPFFFGNFDSNYTENGSNVALFSGAALPLLYQVTSSLKPIIPIGVSVDSGFGNGIDNIIVRKNKDNFRYQAHYLRWLAPPDALPPSRVGTTNIDEESVPQAIHSRLWNYNNSNHALYNHKLNPSKYSDRVECSKGYIVHPDDGVYGTLPNMIFNLPHGMLEGDVIEIPFGDGCDVTKQPTEYEYVLTEAYSPLSQKPGTPFRPTAIGLQTRVPNN
jgi:hypothetical protein